VSEQPDIAFLGTGLMGQGMVRRLLSGGLPVRVWNRTAAKAAPLAGAGARVAASPVEAASGAGVVITMLSDIDAVWAAMYDGGALAAMTPGAIWIQMSTVGLPGTARLAGAASVAGVRFVDAPVLGSRQPAEEGKLKILAAGPAELRPWCEPIFARMGTLFCWLDQVGQASALKLVANSWVLALIGGAATSIRLARQLGLDPELFLNLVTGTASDSPYLHMKGEAILSGDYTPSFTVSAAAKDADLIVRAGRGAGFEPVLIEVVREQLERAASRGHGDEDMAAIYLGNGG
jgi:3-hydroxyisobutyrate dehydrogenase